MLLSLLGAVQGCQFVCLFVVRAFLVELVMYVLLNKLQLSDGEGGRTCVGQKMAQWQRGSKQSCDIKKFSIIFSPMSLSSLFLLAKTPSHLQITVNFPPSIPSSPPINRPGGWSRPQSPASLISHLNSNLLCSLLIPLLSPIYQPRLPTLASKPPFFFQSYMCSGNIVSYQHEKQVRVYHVMVNSGG